MMSAEGTGRYLPNDDSFSSRAIHMGSNPDQWGSSVLVPPICLATTYKQELPPHHKGYEYTRLSSPTRDCLEKCLASLENTKHCIVLSSGMAAVSVIVQLLQDGDHAVVQGDLYHGVFNLFKTINAKSKHIDISIIGDCDPAKIKEVLQKNTKIVWLESPTNPLMKLIDLKLVTTIVKNEVPSAIVVCDNTFMSPYFQRPAKFGVDIVMHSCSKFIGGHSDVLMGALCTNNEVIYKQLREIQVSLGPVPSSFDCFLVIRSLKTLEIRMQKHMSNAIAVAMFLDKHPLIEKVMHPGLKSHPQHELSLRQCYGHSGIMSFYVRGHDLKTTTMFMSKLRLIQIADSLGGTETTIKMPSQMPQGSLTQEEMDEQSITDGLLRLSVGLESSEDLIQDLDQALTFIDHA